MFEAGDIREWRGHGVVDSSGHKIGTLESVYVDTGTDQPAFAAVTVGLPTRHRLVFAPPTRATVGAGDLKGTSPKRPGEGPPAKRTGREPATRDAKRQLKPQRAGHPPP